MTSPNYTSEKKTYTVEEYFQLLQESVLRVEFLNGSVRYMAGGTVNHSLLCNNAGSALNQALKGKPCVAYNSDLQVSIEKRNSYVLPDVTIICGSVQLSEQDKNSVTNPTLVVEVTSSTSKDYDYGTKFQLYRTISSLKEYVLINQDELCVDVFVKRKGVDIWQFKTFKNIDDTIELESIGITVSLSELYENFSFETKSSD